MKYRSLKEKRPTVLQHYKTGRIVSAESIGEFCRKVGLTGNDRYHLTPILDGERVHHKGWHLPCTKSYVLLDIRGNVYRFTNPVSFSKKHKLSTPRIVDLVNGKISFYRGLYVAGTQAPVTDVPHIREVTLERDGVSITTNNLSATARMLHIGPHSIYKAINGEQSHAHQWVVKKIVRKPKKERLYD